MRAAVHKKPNISILFWYEEEIFFFSSSSLFHLFDPLLKGRHALNRLEHLGKKTGGGGHSLDGSKEKKSIINNNNKTYSENAFIRLYRFIYIYIWVCLALSAFMKFKNRKKSIGWHFYKYFFKTLWPFWRFTELVLAATHKNMSIKA